MDKDFVKILVAQLRKPTGEFGLEVAANMNVCNREMNLSAIDALNIQTGETILEIGFGNGLFAKDVLNVAAGVRYIGCDYATEMVKAASINNRELTTRGAANFLEARIEQMPLHSYSVNKIFTVNTLYFWDDLDAAFEEMKRLLIAGGLLAIAFRPESCLRQYPASNFGFTHFSSVQVENLLNEYGFTVQQVIHETEPETEILGRIVLPEYVVVVGRFD